jgi:XTP/dITP diphosphohydrolase
VHSAYYAGRDGDRATRDARNNAKLLVELAKQNDRRAHYVCVLVLVRSASDPQPVIAEGEWHGEILAAPRGSGGFGYDPLFLVPSANCSSAELTEEAKNAVSHRAVAFAKLAERLRAGI